MTETVQDRLNSMRITLPAPAAPVANYVPFVMTGNLLFISGQVPFGPDGIEYIGTLGGGLSVEDGQAAARLCAINILAQANVALRNLDRITRCVKLGGFVACTPDFTDHPKVINGASDIMVDVLGDAGRHARFAVGAPSLPLGVSVEVDAVIEFE